MDLIEKVSETVTANGKKAVDKAKELTEIAGLKKQIAACEEGIWKNYLEIGKMVVAQYKQAGKTDQGVGGDPATADRDIFPYEKQCKAVLNAQAGVKDLERRIRERRAFDCGGYAEDRT